MKQNVILKLKISGLLCLLLSIAIAPPVQAEKITIGKGTGAQWEGMPFNVTLSGTLAHLARPALGLAAISNLSGGCIRADTLASIGGVNALQIAPGVGLIPRAVADVSFTRADGTADTLTGTIGIPGSKATVGSSGETIESPIYDSTAGWRDWCMPPTKTYQPSFYNTSAERKSHISGTWVLVTDGSQKSQDGIKIPTMYAGSYSSTPSGDRTAVILPSTIELRISNLECSVNTPTAINFGAVLRDLTPDAELSRITNQFNITCGQDTDKINANINVQFRAITGLYKGEPSRLSLKQGGGYITGEIPGITADAGCGGTGGVTFDNQLLKIGEITSSEERKTFTNQIAWRLCSGGADLPVGKVDAAAELLVTYN